MTGANNGAWSSIVAETIEFMSFGCSLDTSGGFGVVEILVADSGVVGAASVVVVVVVVVVVEVDVVVEADEVGAVCISASSSTTPPRGSSWASTVSGPVGTGELSMFVETGVVVSEVDVSWLL